MPPMKPDELVSGVLKSPGGVKPDYGRLSLVDCLEAGKTSMNNGKVPAEAEGNPRRVDSAGQLVFDPMSSFQELFKVSEVPPPMIPFYGGAIDVSEIGEIIVC